MRARRALAVTLLVSAAVVLTGGASAFAHTVERGIGLPDSYWSDNAARQAAVEELYTDLRAGWVRFDMSWRTAEPAEGVYDEAYIASIAATCTQAHDLGIHVLLSVWKVPEWASDKSLWSPPAWPDQPGYRSYYAPAVSKLPRLTEFMQHLSQACGDAVWGYECWNEPNLWMFLYPQIKGSDKQFGARRYVAMLKAFHAGVAQGAPAAKVVAGALGPYGVNDRYRTDPYRFAVFMKNLGAAPYLDYFSDHPYQVGSSSTYPPERLPRFPDRSVTLSNLGPLLKLYSTKPFILTEYGYTTTYSLQMGGLPVSQPRQADYLRRAYAYAGRYGQVKALLWYLLRDESASGTWNTGLRTFGGARKRAWYAFSRATRLTLQTSAQRIKRGTRVTFSGALTWSPRNGSPQGLGGRQIRIERRRSGGVWVLVKAVSTTADGGFSLRLRPSGTAVYRARWEGVTASPGRTVSVY